jgi:DNA ligase D-like protein (predicted 3'-phosphoesterase)
MQVADHPLDYGSFEGVLGPGYGAGAVIVWDTGTYDNLREGETMAEGLDHGHVSVWLHGEKLRGGWSLRRTGGGQKPRWLMVKRRDAEADARRRPVSTQPESVLTGRTIEDLQRQRSPSK